MTYPDPHLDCFAEALMRHVRDEAIRTCDGWIRRARAGEGEGALSAHAGDERVAAALDDLIPEVVDQALFAFLHYVDNDEYALWGIRLDGEAVPMEDFGHWESRGWLVGVRETSWQERFSEERIPADSGLFVED